MIVTETRDVHVVVEQSPGINALECVRHQLAGRGTEIAIQVFWTSG